MDNKNVLPLKFVGNPITGYNISKKEVQDFSSTSAGRMDLNSAMITPNEIAEELINILNLNQ